MTSGGSVIVSSTIPTHADKESISASNNKSSQTAATNSHSSGKPITLCIFCGAKLGIASVYADRATALAKAMCVERWNLVYGGGSGGLMGTISSTMVSLSSSEAVHGIMCKLMLKYEENGMPPPILRYGRTTIANDMHEQKVRMSKEADVFVVLPGGFGTIEELFIMTTWKQHNIHSCPIVIFNVDGFFNGLLKWMNQAVDAGLLDQKSRSMIVEADSVEGIVEAIKRLTAVSRASVLDSSSG